MFDRILIANRGEIACRIIRTCRRMQVGVVAVASSAELHARHAKLADTVVDLGPPEPRRSYLDIAKIISAAKSTGAKAIHPGYGFLSENPQFADAVESAGLVFIGPSSAVMRKLGDKLGARALAIANSVPVSPGVPLMTAADYQSAHKLRFPVLVKAAAGGGGRGMRKVEKASDLEEAAKLASREAEAFFGDGRVFVEEMVTDARHIEAQILADSNGNVFAVSDRDCSMQRRSQKVIEEAPAQIDEKIRKSLHEAAVKLCRAAGYVNAGTVEFLVNASGIFLLEVNSRLQVEHTVTEAVTGLDLVEWQLRIANGESLPAALPTPEGVAIECRICAEKPEEDFIPATGRILTFELPPEPHVRVDTGFETGDLVTHHYDSLIAKLIVRSPNRVEAMEETLRVMRALRLYGIRSNIGFITKLLESNAFENANHTITSAEAIFRSSNQSSELMQAAAAYVLLLAAASVEGEVEKIGWRASSRAVIERVIMVNSVKQSVRLESRPPSWYLPGLGLSLSVSQREGRTFIVAEGSTFEIHLDATGRWFRTPVGIFEIGAAQADASQAQHAHGAQSVTTSLPGKIIEVKVAAGDKLNAGDLLCIIESMKMEHLIRSSQACMVKEVLIKPNQVVQGGQILFELELTS